METLPEYLTHCRKLHKVGLKDIAKDVGVSLSNVCRQLKGEYPVSDKVVSWFKDRGYATEFGINTCVAYTDKGRNKDGISSKGSLSGEAEETGIRQLVGGCRH